MRWARLLAAIGVAAGASFAVHDEAQHLLAQCEAGSQDRHARLLILSLLFVMHSLVLSAGAYAVLTFRWVGRGLLLRMGEVAVVLVVALAVGFCMAIVDPVLSYLLASTCSALQACSQHGFAESLLRGADEAANWPNTPIVVFMTSLFAIGAFLVQEVADREHKACAPHGVT
jgi:hypothetical protein